MAVLGDPRARVRSLIRPVPGAERAFAEAIGLDEIKLSKSLGGSRRFKAGELMAIAEHCGVTVNWLINGSDDVVAAPAASSEIIRSRNRTDSATQAGTRQMILEMAWRLIAKCGYRNVRISDIAAACGTSTGTIHYYFATKDDVLNESLRHNAKLSFDRQIAELDTIHDALQRLKRLAELQFPAAGLMRDEWSVCLQIWNEAPLNAEVRSLHVDSYNHWYHMVAMTIRLGQEQGAFREQDPDDAAIRLSALINGLGVRVFTETPGSSTFSARRHIYKFIEETISKPSSKSAHQYSDI
jgi:AcrR family transcriptional regulator